MTKILLQKIIFFSLLLLGVIFVLFSSSAQEVLYDFCDLDYVCPIVIYLTLSFIIFLVISRDKSISLLNAAVITWFACLILGFFIEFIEAFSSCDLQILSEGRQTGTVLGILLFTLVNNKSNDQNN